MGNTTKTKAAMLNELESIKGLLLEEDDIPILQEEVIEQAAQGLHAKAAAPQESATTMTAQTKAATRVIFEEQQDFFHAHSHSETIHNHNHTHTHNQSHSDQETAAKDLVDSELLDTLSELEKHTAEVTAGKLAKDAHKHSFARPNLAKATGENPFLPEHIRSRLHGNNPPPLFATETAKKIATSSIPSRQLGNTFTVASNTKSNHQQDIIDSIIDKMMPEIEQELRSRLELMSKTLLEELNK